MRWLPLLPRSVVGLARAGKACTALKRCPSDEKGEPPCLAAWIPDGGLFCLRTPPEAMLSSGTGTHPTPLVGVSPALSAGDHIVQATSCNKSSLSISISVSVSISITITISVSVSVFISFSIYIHSVPPKCMHAAIANGSGWAEAAE